MGKDHWKYNCGTMRESIFDDFQIILRFEGHAIFKYTKEFRIPGL